MCTNSAPFTDEKIRLNFLKLTQLARGRAWLRNVFQSLGSQSVVPQWAASVRAGNLLEMRMIDLGSWQRHPQCERNSGLWGGRSSKEAAGPHRQRLPDGVRPAARAAQERTGAELARQDAKKRPHCPSSPFKSPKAKIRQLHSLPFFEYVAF